MFGPAKGINVLASFGGKRDDGEEEARRYSFVFGGWKSGLDSRETSSLALGAQPVLA